MFIIKYSKILIFVLVIILNSYLVFSAYQAVDGICTQELPAVQLDEWCYPCQEASDEICPNDLVPGVCDEVNWDYDCVIKQGCASRSEGICPVAGSCKWCLGCGPDGQIENSPYARQTYTGASQCIDVGATCTYEWKIGFCNVNQCWQDANCG
ncbi:unnamed protein product, partial [marine sediment metagenome]